MKTSGRSMVVGLAVVAAVATYALSDNAVVSSLSYLVVGIGASIGAWIGAERGPRAARLVPRLIAGGISLSTLADALWTVLDLRGVYTGVSIADPLWLASYVSLCTALWVVLNRGRGPGRVNVDAVIDALTIVAVCVLVFWSFSIEAIVSDPTSTPLERTVWSVYPIADAVLLALVVRVSMSRTARSAIDTWFAAGISLWLAADIAYLLSIGVEAVALLRDVAWMIAPVLLARAAWQVRDLENDQSVPAGVGGWATPLAIAVAPLLAPPTLELVSDLRGRPDQPMLLFTGTAVLITLAFVRTGRLLRSEQRALRELEVARDAALAASHAKSMFLANVSHEVRTPLTTVLATAEILGDTPLNDLQLRLLTKMHRSGDALRRLVEGLLDFSRIEAGKLELAAAPFDLHGVVADVADVYCPRALQAGIGFEWHLDPAVSRTVLGDSGRLFQVLTNLLDNAFKFTPHGQVTLTVRPGPDGGHDEQAQHVTFLVVDTGIGIREEDLELVFESFRQVDGSMTRQHGGSGLGLAICKELTTLMGGSLTVSSQVDVGTTFAVDLPLAHTQQPPSQHHAHQARSSETT